VAPNERSSIPQSSEALACAEEIAEQFSDSLSTVAEEIARSKNAEMVLVPHVEDAHRVLKESGLVKKQPPVWARPGVHAAVGTFIAGLGPTIACMAKDFIESDGKSMSQAHPVAMWLLVIVLPGLIFFGGGILAAIGFARSK